MSFDVPGRLIEFPATQGMVFKFGELLGRLDETNFVARVDSARADFNNAHTELARRRQLHQRGVISRSELDGFQRANDVAEAALREAQRALDDTRMVAPFDGRVARTLVNNFQNVQARPARAGVPKHFDPGSRYPGSGDGHVSGASVGSPREMRVISLRQGPSSRPFRTGNLIWNSSPLARRPHHPRAPSGSPSTSTRPKIRTFFPA